MRGDSEERILPLINIVFLLLIFFMVVGQLAPVDELIEEPLQSAAGQSPGVAVSVAPLMLQMSAVGELALDGVRVEEGELLRRLTEGGTGDNAGVGSPGLWFKVDGRTEAAAVIRLMNRLRDAGVPDVRLLTLHADTTAHNELTQP